MQGRLLAFGQRSEQGGPILYQRRRYSRMAATCSAMKGCPAIPVFDQRRGALSQEEICHPKIANLSRRM